MTYPETIEFLYGIRLFGQKLGLETMQYLLRLMGDPHMTEHLGVPESGDRMFKIVPGRHNTLVLP